MNQADKGGGLRQEKLLAGLDRAEVEGWTSTYVGTRQSDGRAVIIASCPEVFATAVASLHAALPASADDACVMHGPFTIDAGRAFIEASPGLRIPSDVHEGETEALR